MLLAASDTFRAAAREQLQTWGERNGVAVIAQESGDPAAVMFDAVNAARRAASMWYWPIPRALPPSCTSWKRSPRQRRVINKGRPHRPARGAAGAGSDSNIGQNALMQVKAFDKAIGVTGLVLTKLDGTAKGGVVAAISRQCPKPLRFIGVGEASTTCSRSRRASSSMRCLRPPLRTRAELPPRPPTLRPDDCLRSRKSALSRYRGRSSRCQLQHQPGRTGRAFGPFRRGQELLVKLIPAIERPSSGRVLVGDQDVGRPPRQAIAFLRRRIGLVLQESRLLLDRDIFDNVMLPLLITGHSATDAAKRANALERVGLSGRGKEMPLALSGGEQQRAAIARAVVNRPSILLADEPTAHLDAAYARDIAALFQSFHAAGVTVISPPMTRTCSRTCSARRMTLNQGQLNAQEPARAGSATTFSRHSGPPASSLATSSAASSLRW